MRGRIDRHLHRSGIHRSAEQELRVHGTRVHSLDAEEKAEEERRCPRQQIDLVYFPHLQDDFVVEHFDDRNNNDGRKRSARDVAHNF